MNSYEIIYRAKNRVLAKTIISANSETDARIKALNIKDLEQILSVTLIIKK